MESLHIVLAKTPFELKEIKTLQSLREQSLPRNVKHKAQLEKIHAAHTNNSNATVGGGHFKSNLVTSMASISLRPKEAVGPLGLDIEPVPINPFPSKSDDRQLTDLLLSNANDDDNLASGSILMPSVSDPTKLSSNSMTDFLSVSPSFGPCSLTFDNQSFDETTSEEFAPTNFLQSVSNINYEFTFSDNSAENSISEDAGDASSICHGDDNMAMQSKPLDTISTFSIDEFDPLRSTHKSAEPTDKAHNSMAIDLPAENEHSTTLIDSADSPNRGQLPSPLKPIATGYKGFSNLNIPTISCNTGDFSLPNYSNDTDPNT